MSGQLGFRGFEDRLSELSAQGDPLENLASIVDFEMFRMLVLQALHDGLPGSDRMPPARPGALDALFARLDRAISEAGYLPMGGLIVDATLVAALASATPMKKTNGSSRAKTLLISGLGNLQRLARRMWMPVGL